MNPADTDHSTSQGAGRWRAARSATYRASVIESQGSRPPPHTKSATSPASARRVAFEDDPRRYRVTSGGSCVGTSGPGTNGPAIDCKDASFAIDCKRSPASTAPTTKKWFYR